MELIERQKNYRALFAHRFYAELLENIRSATNKDMVVGNDRFREEIKPLTGRRVKEKKRGGSAGWRKSDC